MATVLVVNSYLLVLGERQAIVWVVREERMAFPATRRAELGRLAEGDRLFLYATRGAWHNPTRDRGRIIGEAKVVGPVRRFDAPIVVAGRDFHSGCPLQIEGLIPYPHGVELAPLVPQLRAFPKPDSWSVYMRRSLVPLPVEDASLVASAVGPMLQSRVEALPTYEDGPTHALG
jgi:hypothetical protein